MAPNSSPSSPSCPVGGQPRQPGERAEVQGQDVAGRRDAEQPRRDRSRGVKAHVPLASHDRPLCGGEIDVQVGAAHVVRFVDDVRDADRQPVERRLHAVKPEQPRLIGRGGGPSAR